MLELKEVLYVRLIKRPSLLKEKLGFHNDFTVFVVILYQKTTLEAIT